MTIAATTTSVQYTRNGTTTQWSFPNKIFSASDLVVTDLDTSTPPVQTLLVLNTDYTVQNVDVDTGCFITTTLPGTSGHTLDIRTNIAETQSTSIKNQGAFYPELHEEAFDRVTRELQDLKRLTYTFGLHGPDIEVTPWPALPIAVSRRGYALMFDPISGLPTLGTPNTQTITTGLLAPFLNLQQTAAEQAAGITPTNLQYAPGNVLRYGANTVPGTTDMTTAITSAIAQALQPGGSRVYFPATGLTTGNDYLVTSEIQITGEVQFVGETERLSGKGPRIVSNLNGNTFAVRTSAAIAVTFEGLGFYSSAAGNTNQGAFFYIAPSLSGPNSFYFRNCWFYLPNYWALNFAGQCDDVQIEFCTFDVSNNKFIAIGSAGQTVTDFRCIGSTFYGGEASFLGCVDLINAQNVIFQGNCFYPINATYPMPYAINAGSSLGAAVKNLVVNGNTFGSPTVGAVNAAVLISSGVTQCSITGNAVYNANSLAIGGGGGVTINQAVITGNTITGYSGASLGLIDFTGTTLTNSVIANNALVGNVGGTSVYGVNLNGASNTGNVIGPNAINGVTTPYNITSWAGNFGVAGPITFTATLTGYASNPTCTARYSVNGNTVTLDLPNTNGTSNATTMTITGLPAAIQPANQQTFLVQVEDNTVFELGTLTVVASGTIAMATGATGAGAFTNAGTKGIGTISVTYQLT